LEHIRPGSWLLFVNGSVGHAFFAQAAGAIPDILDYLSI